MQSLLIPFYNTWLDSYAKARISRSKDIHEFTGFNGPIGLSSIGPDECVTNEAFFVDFMKFSIDLNFDYVVAWDEPTYVDWPAELSWKYTIYGLEKVRRLIRQDFNVIGLINGSNKMHFRGCAEGLLAMGVDSVAVHVSDYLRDRRIPTYGALLRDVMEVANSKFKKVLVIGATDPYFIKTELMSEFPKVSVAGLGWYLDAEKGHVYDYFARVNVNKIDAICSCEYCRTRKPQDLSRWFLTRAIHNFLAVKDAIEGRSLPKLEKFDIAHKGQKLMIVSGLLLGTKGSLLRDLYPF